LSASEKSWPSDERRRRGERRKVRDRRTGVDRRREDGWQPVPLDEPTTAESALFDAARSARRHAQAPYSTFLVGAALEHQDGAVSTGCNIENASYGLTMCAERVALFKALSDGITHFSRILVVADTETPTPPCGPCRQLLWEYCGDIEVILANLEGPAARYRLAELLPLPFDRRLLR
jgi:cytidine deaminase